MCKKWSRRGGMAFLLLLILMGVSNGLNAQKFNNEWIVNGKSYFKFKIATDGLYRITGSSLTEAGLSGATGSNLQLWRNGIQIPIYVSKVGALASNDYIEFWGEHNDGSVDTALFKKAEDQLNKAKSFEGDSASYFLTINTNTSQNLRITNGANTAATDAAGMTTVPYFYYTIQKELGTTFNAGAATVYGTSYVYMSDYKGKCFGTVLNGSKSTSAAFSDLYGYTADAAIKGEIKVGIAGASTQGNNRSITVKGEDGATKVAPLGNFESKIIKVEGAEVGNSYKVTITNGAGNTADKVNASYVELHYPRTFNFGGATSFSFDLGGSSSPRLLNITNFAANGSTPILYNLTTGIRYHAEKNGTNYQFVLPGMDSSHFALVGQASNSYTSISSTIITKRSFPDFTSSDQQGDYLIISNKALYGNGDYVAQYASYRKSPEGGNYNVHIYNIDDLEDMFAFGVHSSPLSIINFLKYARHNFTTAPKFVFLIGRGLTFNNLQGANESDPLYQAQNLIPTFGWPASDIMLASENKEPIAATAIGRLSAVKSEEIKNYLDKVKVYEAAQKNDDNTIENNGWKKNVVFISGGGSQAEDDLFNTYLNGYKNIINGSYFGAQSFNLRKMPTEATPNNFSLKDFIDRGAGLICYYGHGASTTIGYGELNDPSIYNFHNRYPIVITSGCDVGDCYSFMAGRSLTLNNIVERYLFGRNVGTVGFVAETYLGVTSYLDFYNKSLFSSISFLNYGLPITKSMQGSQALLMTPDRIKNTDSITNYAHAEQTNFFGDPVISLYSFSKPDFAVEDGNVVIPSSVSITAGKFSIKAYIYNLGRSVGDSVQVFVKHKFPDGTIETLLTKKLASIRSIDSLSLDVDINANKDVGNNQIIVSIDDDNQYDELSEGNNSVTKSIYIYANGISPIYPYNYSIIHNSSASLIASTSDALALEGSYVMELDTTQLFNSSSLVTKTVKSIGGAISFDPGITYKDGTVYYWRVSPVPTNDDAYRWANSSFQYLTPQGASDFEGAGQAHLFQHEQSFFDGIGLDTVNRDYTFNNVTYTLNIPHAVLSSIVGASNFGLKINNKGISNYYCTTMGNSLMFNILTPTGLKPYFNQSVPSLEQTVPNAQIGGFMGSVAACKTSPYSFDTHPDSYPDVNKYNFQFKYQTKEQRDQIASFMKWIPENSYVVVRLFITTPFDAVPLVNDWKADGVGDNTLYQQFIDAGLTSIDEFTTPGIGVFIYKKSDNNFIPVQELTNNTSAQIQMLENVTGKDSIGFITSPKFGPAKEWKSVEWSGKSIEATNTDNVSIDVLGVTPTGDTTNLFTIDGKASKYDISSVDAVKYPYVQLRMRNADGINYTPYQLDYWRVYYTPVPEGALAGNIALESQDTIDIGQDLKFGIAFKNVSDQVYSDSIKANVTLRDKSNQLFTIPIRKLKAIQPGDTAMVYITIPGDTSIYNAAHPNEKMPIGTMDLGGEITLGLDINPSMDPLEQTHDNNFLYKTLYVRTEQHNTQLDVTFDGIHILDNDIVAAKPVVAIRVSDDSKYLLLNDTSVAKISLVYPDGTVKKFGYNSDTLTFTPAKDSVKNEALIDFRPYLTQDGTYQLIVKGQGKTGDASTVTDYSVNFQVYNKPMISDMFNYPNPFTSSTAFVFTITGTQVPQNIRIQILTVTGKIVKEITKDELGPLHIGRNITDYKWDGTDSYGQKLANGVYIYRVITNQDGKKLDHFTIKDTNGNEINTSKYFTKGYGKMYLMR